MWRWAETCTASRSRRRPATSWRSSTPRAGAWDSSICYDVRFPELYRILALHGAELVTVPAAFTLHTGKDHWELLLRARAVENQCYVMAAASWGVDEDGRATYGRSMIVDPWGLVLACAPDEDAVVVADIDAERLRAIRTALPSLANRVPGAYRWPSPG